jgi:6,7-dimethyl-8-ribityllumazine synthase
LVDSSKILIVDATFYQDIADHLVSGAVDALKDEGYAWERISVPGVFEVPATIALAAKSRENFSGFVALGCVIRGETDHYDHVCRESSRACMDLSVQTGLAIGFGILTCENMDQAIARADVNQGNKGRDAAQACLRMVDLKSRFRG